MEMSEKQHRIQYLLKAYTNRTRTREELEELFGYIREAENDEALYAFMSEYYQQLSQNLELKEPEWEQMFSRIIALSESLERPKAKKIRFNLSLWYTAAAVIVVALGVGIYFLFLTKQSKSELTVVKNSVIDVAPGTDKAILTLADGSSVKLDSAGQKQILQGSISIKQQDGQLTYEAKNSANVSTYNTLSTPRGGQYHLVLFDGTQVWLNNASSIRYPVALSGNDREVTVTGEAYFEVVHDPVHPFIVKVGTQVIKDIGTSFDIEAYSDEPNIKTTLIKGAIKVNDVLLKPGEQATVTGNDVKITEANIEQVMAWKNGLFYFDDFGFATVMRMLARWYNIDVVYEGGIPTQHFEGAIPRNYNLGDLLAILKASNVHFTLKGNQLLITK